MRNKLGILTVIVAGTLLVVGCGTPSNQSNSSTSGSSNATSNQTTSTSSATTVAPPQISYSGPVVATYNGGKLTKQELDRMYNMLVVLPGTKPKTPKQTFLNQYAVFKYMYGQALKSSIAHTVNLTQAKQSATQALQQLASTQKLTQAELQKNMKSLGLTENDLVQFFEEQEYLDNYVQNVVSKVKVSNTQALNYYNSHKSDYIQVTVSHILLKTKSEALKVEAKLKAGANFAKMADKYSTDPGVKQNHGTYANSLVSSFVTPFANACKTLPIGKISAPVHSQYGWHIIRVEKRKQLTFSQAKSDIEQTLLQQLQQQKPQQMYAQAQADVKVKVVKGATL